MTYAGHVHHNVAKAWFEQIDMEARICFCRFTQLSRLRLLTTEAVMGADEVMTPREAWGAYDRWLADVHIVFLDEPRMVDSQFRSLSDHGYPSPKFWSDAYLAAFARIADLCFVTFDRGFQRKVEHLLILRPSSSFSD